MTGRAPEADFGAADTAVPKTPVTQSLSRCSISIPTPVSAQRCATADNTGRVTSSHVRCRPTAAIDSVSSSRTRSLSRASAARPKPRARRPAPGRRNVGRPSPAAADLPLCRAGFGRSTVRSGCGCRFRRRGDPRGAGHVRGRRVVAAQCVRVRRRRRGWHPGSWPVASSGGVRHPPGSIGGAAPARDRRARCHNGDPRCARWRGRHRAGGPRPPRSVAVPGRPLDLPGRQVQGLGRARAVIWVPTRRSGTPGAGAARFIVRCATSSGNPSLPATQVSQVSVNNV